MKTHKNLYHEIYNIKNLILAYKKARKGKSKKEYVKDFDKDLPTNLKFLQEELQNQTYKPKPLETFILRDPKTRKISRADFRDRVIHHALCNIIEPIFEKIFIYDNCANRIHKGTLFALQRFETFQRKVTNNLTSEAYCLKADIKHYFPEIDLQILIRIVKKKIKCRKTINLIKLILSFSDKSKGMPLGNLTSQFFANVYLSEFDYFVKHKLRAKYYIRYVDDFIILHESKIQLRIWKKEINYFLNNKLKIELHKEKSKIILLSKGVDFVGFRNFYYFRLLRKRNKRAIEYKISLFNKGLIPEEKINEIIQGWCAYAKWANSYNLTKVLFKRVESHSKL